MSPGSRVWENSVSGLVPIDATRNLGRGGRLSLVVQRFERWCVLNAKAELRRCYLEVTVTVAVLFAVFECVWGSTVDAEAVLTAASDALLDDRTRVSSPSDEVDD